MITEILKREQAEAMGMTKISGPYTKDEQWMLERAAEQLGSIPHAVVEYGPRNSCRMLYRDAEGMRFDWDSKQGRARKR